MKIWIQQDKPEVSIAQLNSSTVYAFLVKENINIIFVRNIILHVHVYNYFMFLYDIHVHVHVCRIILSLLLYLSKCKYPISQLLHVN